MNTQAAPTPQRKGAEIVADTVTDAVRDRLAELVNAAQHADALLGKGTAPPLLVCRLGIAVDAAAAELRRLTESMSSATTPRQAR